MAFIRPTTGNVIGLTAVNAKIGTDVPNCRVLILTPRQDENGYITFHAAYFWNAAAYQTWLDETASAASTRSIIPFRFEEMGFQGNELSHPKAQCKAYLLSLPEFANFE